MKQICMTTWLFLLQYQFNMYYRNKLLDVFYVSFSYIIYYIVYNALLLNKKYLMKKNKKILSPDIIPHLTHKLNEVYLHNVPGDNFLDSRTILILKQKRDYQLPFPCLTKITNNFPKCKLLDNKAFFPL